MQACILAVGRGVKKVVWEEDADGMQPFSALCLQNICFWLGLVLSVCALLLLTKNENLLLGGGRPKTVTQMLVTLSVDHRVYDGETGGRFLKALHANLSDPKRMLL
jgi:pyruvate/2-oxoglutarate dehydrogenase complex dihydrolipoamide acyltransferase (E2) component